MLFYYLRHFNLHSPKIIITSFKLFVSLQNDIGAFTVPHDAELQTKEHVVVYDSNTGSLKDKSELFSFYGCCNQN